MIYWRLHLERTIPDAAKGGRLRRVIGVCYIEIAEDMSEHLLEGTVICGHGKHFVVYAAGKCYTCQMRKKVKFKTSLTTPVAVGDDVLISAAGENDGSIEEVRPRRSVLSRPTVGREDSEHVLAANIDALVIVASVDSPPLKPGLIDRFLIAAQLGNLAPFIVINKMDLHLDQASAEAIKIYQNLGFDLALTSAQEGTGLDHLARYLKDHRSILAGHSGVGKSTLLNRLLPGINLPAQEVSQVTGRGRHTTSHIEMFHLPDGGFVIDSPGLKVLGLWQAEKDGLDLYYPEMRSFRDQCRFTHCSHLREPDCAVRDAVLRGEISTLRYENYSHIYDSL